MGTSIHVQLGVLVLITLSLLIIRAATEKKLQKDRVRVDDRNSRYKE